jgi:hypothetical protein
MATPHPPPGLGAAAIARLDELARLRESVEIGSVSTYDPSEANDDGFSGEHSFIRREGDGLVIAELTGPGILYRFHTPTPTDDLIEFYFDGEAEPRIRMPMRHLFIGGHAPFLPPLVAFGAGGYYSYVPLAYEKKLKIVVRMPVIQFFQLNFARYPESAGIRTYTTGSEDSATARARAVLARAGEDVSRFVAPPNVTVVRHTATRTISPGGRATLFQAQQGGRLVGIRLSPASAFAGKDRSAELRIHWDGDPQPAVAGPVGDLLGFGWGAPAMTSLLAGTARDTGYMYFPMPYDRSATVEIVRHGGRNALTVNAEFLTAAVPRRPDEGRFYALWHRENPTTTGRPFTFLKTTGRGHIVGAVLQSQGIDTEGTPFFEGDDRVVIDGETAIHGTGSEDSFNGGWYDVPGRWDRRRSFPLSGSLGYSNSLARTGGYRFYLGDAYAYRKSIDFTIEHGDSTSNNVPTDYAAVTYFYSAAPPVRTVGEVSAAKLAVRDPEKIILHPGWVTPIYSFSFQNAALRKLSQKGIGRFLSLIPDSSAPNDLGPHAVDLMVTVATAGRYRVSLQTVFGPAQGIVQLFENDQPIGNTLDMYASERRMASFTPMATLVFEEGDNYIQIRLPGKNPRASGSGLDLGKVMLERVP